MTRVLFGAAVLAYVAVTIGAFAIWVFLYNPPYLALSLTPIPVLAPWQWIRGTRLERPYLWMQTTGVAGVVILRLVLDLWLPVNPHLLPFVR